MKTQFPWAHSHHVVLHGGQSLLWSVSLHPLQGQRAGASGGCCDKGPHTEWLKTTQIDDLASLGSDVHGGSWAMLLLVGGDGSVTSQDASGSVPSEPMDGATRWSHDVLSSL